VDGLTMLSEVKNRNIFIIKAKVRLLMFAAMTLHKVTSVPSCDEDFL